MAPGPMVGTKARRRFDPLLLSARDDGGGLSSSFVASLFSMRSDREIERERGKEKEATSQTLNPTDKV